jgi:hypothetical protein
LKRAFVLLPLLRALAEQAQIRPEVRTLALETLEAGVAGFEAFMRRERIDPGLFKGWAYKSEALFYLKGEPRRLLEKIRLGR